VPDWLHTTIRQRCPACDEGSLFERGLSMRDSCATCGLNLVGEDGAQYGGAISLSYGAGGIAALVTLFVWLRVGELPRWTVWVVLAVAVVTVIGSFRFSKSFWTWLLYRSGELNRGAVDR
jgi:uncharacterized protein (DUF983 family)